MSDTYTEFGALHYDPNQIARQGYGVASSGPTDEKLIVGFYRKSILNSAKSKEQGKRICEDRDFVMIQHPGENLTKVDRPVQDSDKVRWPRQWAQYSQGRKQVPDGIPITLLYPDKPSITDMLISYNIHTVEQLANLSADGIQTVGMGCQEWVNKAGSYLKQAEKGVDFHRFEQERERKDQQIATLERQVRDLGAQLQKFMAAAPEPKNFDQQTAFINNREVLSPQPPQTFSQEIVSPDLSGMVRQRKPRADKGKPRGPRKET